MALPKRKISTRRKGKRRAVKKAALPNVVKCRHCGGKKLPHVSCSNCTKY